MPKMGVLIGLCAATFGLLTLWAGCGGEASTASKFASSYCDLLKPCCSKAGLATDGQQCRLLIGFLGSGYRADKGKACLDELREASTQSDFCELDDADSATCNEVFASSTGKNKPGEGCEFDDDCAASSEGDVECASEFVNNAQIRKCQIQIRGKEGDMPCSGTVDGSFTFGSGARATDVPARAYLCHVSDGLRCSSESGACAKIQPAGGVCNRSFDQYACVDTAFCDQAKMMCVAKQAVGSPCSFSSLCVDTAYCDEATDVCVARRADGATCDEDEQCLSDNCVNTKCAKDSNADDFGLAFICGEK